MKAKPVFSVTYEIVTPESAEDGEAEERGYICENVPFREALTELHRTRTNAVDGVESIEADSSAGTPRWVTVFNGLEFWTGAQESRSLHFPDGLKPTTARRLARLAGVRS